MFFLFFCCLFISLNTCFAVDLVRCGKPCADIVIDEKADPGIRMAAGDLQKYLQQISGAKLNIVTPASSRSKIKICVGESSCTRKLGYKLPRFHHSGYDILVKDNFIILNGPSTFHTESSHPFEKSLHEQSRKCILTSSRKNIRQLHISSADDCGPMHAVSAFLESLGVRFYAPYTEGTIVPQMKTISVPNGRMIREAAFARREYQTLDTPLDADGILWLKRLKDGSALPRIGYLPLALVMKNERTRHPEWLSFEKCGLQMVSLDSCGVPRYLFCSFQNECIRYLRQMFDECPDMKYVVLAEPVSRGFTDFRDIISARGYVHFPFFQEKSIRILFLTRIACELKKTHPDRKLIYVNFRNTSMAGRQFIAEKPDNLLIAPGNISVHQFAGTAFCKSLEQTYLPFAEKDKIKAEQHEFWNDLEWESDSRTGFWSLYSLQQFRKSQTGYLSGFLMDLPADRSNKLAEVPLTHLAVYVNSKLLWEPELDLKALLDEYYTLWYGPAAEKMRDFQIFAESVSARSGSRSITLKHGKMQPSDIPVWFELLKKAKDCTAAGSVYRKRVESLESSFVRLKTAFQEKNPQGAPVQASVFPYNAPCDGNLSKYKDWIFFPSEPDGRKTEISVAFSETRSLMQIGFRCYEKNMMSADKRKLPDDSSEIFKKDHVEFSFFTQEKGIFTIAVDAAGSLFDGSNDSSILDSFGSFAGWNNQRTRCCVLHFADRWEGEVFIDIHSCGKPPDWAPEWGLNAARINYENGQKRKVTLVPGTDVFPASGTRFWRRLSLPKRDAAGHLCRPDGNVLLPLPQIKHEQVYTVHKAKGKVELSDPWDSATWKNIPEIRLGYEIFNPEASSGFRPDARAKIQYDEKYIYILYKVDDRYVRAVFKNDQDMVCLDSAMEIFLRPGGKGKYYNFEANCLGALLLYECQFIGPRFTASPISRDELKTIKRFSTMSEDISREIKDPVTWRMGLQIPIEFFVRHSQIRRPLSHQVWTANIMKCADWTSHPCWLIWQPAATFHSPEEFGTFIFE